MSRRDGETDWVLGFKFVKERDEGMYECQVGQTDRQTDRQTHRHTDTKTHRKIGRQTDRPSCDSYLRPP